MPQPNKKSAKQRVMFALPIFILPVAAIIFLVLSFHKKSSHPAPAGTATGAFNTRLPTPNLSKKPEDKLELYLQAEQDSLKHSQQLAKDPYARALYAQGQDSLSLTGSQSGQASLGRNYATTGLPLDQNILKANQSLQRLYAAMSHYSTDSPRTAITPRFMTNQTPAPPDPDRARNDSLVNAIRSLDTGTDPKLRQINSVLDKVLDIQHPERLAQRGQAEPRQETAYAVTAAGPGNGSNESNGSAADPAGSNGFYGLSDDNESQPAQQASIRAVVHETETLVSGAIVKLRLLQDIFVGGTRIPVNTFLFGECSLNGDRLDIHLSNIVYNDHLYPISLKVYDGVDGLEGLFVPGAITRDVLKEGTGQGVSSMALGTLDPSLGAQALQAGVETAKSLLNKKIRLIQVTIKAGHTVILKDPNAR